MTEQRRRLLERRIREIETRRALVEDKILGAGTNALPEWAHELSALEAELDDAQRELDGITGGSAQEQSRGRAVILLNQRLAELERKVVRLEAMQATVLVLLVVDILVRVLFR
jgi:hypothetical protein